MLQSICLLWWNLRSIISISVIGIFQSHNWCLILRKLRRESCKTYQSAPSHSATHPNNTSITYVHISHRCNHYNEKLLICYTPNRYRPSPQPPLTPSVVRSKTSTQKPKDMWRSCSGLSLALSRKTQVSGIHLERRSGGRWGLVMAFRMKRCSKRWRRLFEMVSYSFLETSMSPSPFSVLNSLFSSSAENIPE